jgi:hypothetical protein
MAISSRYVQLSQTVLLEYIYSDQEEINVAGNQWRIDTNDTPIWILKNEYTGQNQILNADSAKEIENGVAKNTGNVRDRSFAVIGSHKGALLDTNRTTFYNDYDPKLTKTVDLPLIIDNKSPIYDRVRVHMVQGFDFEGNVGLVLSLKFKDNKNTDIVLSNFALLKDGETPVANPSAFFFGGRVYNTYVEFKILSLYNLIEDYWLRKGSPGFFVERLVGENGIKRNQFIQLYFSFIKEKTKVNNQDYIDLIDVKSIDLPIRDQFEKISAFIKESDAFDYIEYYATFGGDIIDSYINMLNNNGGAYMIIHELNISEYVFDPTSGNHAWIFVDKLQGIQDSEFGRVNTYRPVIKNPGAISFKIDYTVRLFNKNDGSQVWKQSSMISKSVNKYGKKLKSINIAQNVIKAKIYNQSIVKEINVSKLPEKYISDTKYITSLFNIVNVSVSSGVYPDRTSGYITQQLLYDDSLPEKIYDNGLGVIHIPNSTCFIQFNVYERSSISYNLKNLSGFEDFVISFTDGTLEDFDIPDYPDPKSERSKGQITFKISKDHASRILAFQNKIFTIYQKNELGEKTYLYSGKFYSTEEFNKIAESEKISQLESMLNEMNNRLTTSNSSILIQQNEIKKLNDEILSISKSNTELSKKVAETDPTTALDMLRKENALLQNKLSGINSNSSNTIIDAIKNGTLTQNPNSQKRNNNESLADLWNTNQNPQTTNQNWIQTLLEKNSAATVKTTNVSNFNPRSSDV